MRTKNKKNRDYKSKTFEKKDKYIGRMSQNTHFVRTLKSTIF